MNLKKITTIMVTILVMGIVLTPALVLAQTGPDFGTGYIGGSTLPSSDVRDVAVNLINILLSVLGLIFLFLVLYGGFLWMTAGGDDSRAEKGRAVIRNGVIGLIVIFVAFAITTFIFNILVDASA